MSLLYSNRNSHAGIDAKFIVSRACELQNTKRGYRWFWKNKEDEAEEEQKSKHDFVTDWDKDLKVLVTHLESSLKLRKLYRRCFKSKCLFFHPGFKKNMLSWIYIGTKTLALLLAIVQLFIVQVLYIAAHPSCSFVYKANVLVIKNLQCII